MRDTGLTVLFDEGVDEFLYGYDFIESVRICSCEGESVFKVAFLGICQRAADTVRNLFEITASETLPWTFKRFFAASGNSIEEVTANRSARQANGAVDNNDVFFGTVQESLFETIGSVTLIGGDKSCPHLDALSTELHYPADILAGVDTARGDDGDVLAELLLVWLDC